MICYASLHTAEPLSQTDHEVAYQGYRRVVVEFTEDFGNQPIQVRFPAIEQVAEGAITHICIGTSEAGDGDVKLVVHSMPYIQMTKTADDRVPTICIINELELPEHLNPIARVAYQLWYYKHLDAESLHPQLYEAINDALHNAGMPVIPVVRGGAATWDVKMEQLNFKDWGNA